MHDLNAVFNTNIHVVQCDNIFGVRDSIVPVCVMTIKICLCVPFIRLLRMLDGLCAAAMCGSFAALSDGSPVRRVRLSYQSQRWMSRRFYVKPTLKSAGIPTL